MDNNLRIHVVNSKQYRMVAIVVVITVGLCAVLACMWHFGLLGVDHQRWFLPRTATEVKDEYIASSNLGGDFFYVLRARVTSAEFEDIKSKLGVVPIFGKRRRGREYSWLGVPPPADTWWDPSESLEDTYGLDKYEGSRMLIVKYERGCVYYLESVGY